MAELLCFVWLLECWLNLAPKHSSREVLVPPGRRRWRERASDREAFDLAPRRPVPHARTQRVALPRSVVASGTSLGSRDHQLTRSTSVLPTERRCRWLAVRFDLNVVRCPCDSIPFDVSNDWCAELVAATPKRCHFSPLPYAYSTAWCIHRRRSIQYIHRSFFKPSSLRRCTPATFPHGQPLYIIMASRANNNNARDKGPHAFHIDTKPTAASSSLRSR